MLYFAKTPWWLQKLYGNCTWKMPAEEKIIYLSFDDGPHPEATPFALDVLKDYRAKATFFCIGKNVVAHPGMYERILAEGHAVGNHTFNHLNGWKTPDAEYLQNIIDAKKHINSSLFRPPYGRATKSQLRRLTDAQYGFKAVMWTVLSGDFDATISKEQCLRQVVDNSAAGSIVVFHDSEKAFERMQYALPKALDFFIKKGYCFEKIPG